MPRPRTPGSGGSAALPGKPTPGLQIRWAGFRPMYDYWGEEIRRYYQLDTLAAGVEQLVFSGQDRIILPSVHRILGPAPISSLVFELFQEGKYQLIFRMRAAISPVCLPSAT